MELKGSLRNFPLPDIIQLIGMGRRSGVLSIVTGAGEKAAIYFDSGEMIHAECGGLEGPPVIYRLFKDKEGSFQFASGSRSAKRTIHVDWMTIVMEAARRYDEETQKGDDVFWEEEPETVHESSPDLAELKKKMEGVLEANFGRKAKKIREELNKAPLEKEALRTFCDKAEKYIFVFIDSTKAKSVAQEMRAFLKDDGFI